MGLTVPMMTDPYHPVKYRGHGTGDRLMTLGYLRGWAAHTKANSVLLRASYAEAEALYQSKPMIYAHELLLGHLYLPDYTDEEWAEYERLAPYYSKRSSTERNINKKEYEPSGSYSFCRDRRLDCPFVRTDAY